MPKCSQLVGRSRYAEDSLTSSRTHDLGRPLWRALFHGDLCGQQLHCRHSNASFGQSLEFPPYKTMLVRNCHQGAWQSWFVRGEIPCNAKMA